MIEKLKVLDRVKYTFRTKYRGGHRIHSPYVYNLVREIFMKRRNAVSPSDAELTVALCQTGLKYDYSYRVGQFLKYNHFHFYSMNPTEYNGEELLVVTTIPDPAQFDRMVRQMRAEHQRSAVVCVSIYRNKECRNWWKMQHELQLDLYRIGILIYDGNLNKEYFKLKI
ncbi:MAG: hypothetical protein RR550_02370 [Rikenellaceae bacterium]